MSRPRHAMTTGDGTRRSITLLITLALVAAGMVVVDVASEEPEGRGATTEEVERGNLALAHCPVAAGAGEAASVAVAAVGEEPSDVALLRHEGRGERTTLASHEIEPGERVVTDLETADPITVRSRGGQVTAVWSVAGDRSATGDCPDQLSDQYHLVGLDTSLGSQASLHVHNPFTVDAVVRVRFATAEGPVELVRTENVAVEAGTVQTLDLTELQPEEPELGVIVETVTGRVVAQGEVERTRIDADDDGPQGRALVSASTRLSADAAFAYAVDGDEWSSRLAILNPNDREAAVRVHATDPDPEAPVEEVSVPAGGVARVDLAGRSERRTFAARVESLGDLPVLVSRVESSTGDAASVAVPVGATAPATRWVTAGPSGERSDVLSVYNPGEDPVSVSASVGGEPVETWQGRPVQAGEWQLLHLADVPGGWPAVLTGDGPFVAEVISTVEPPVDEDAEDEGEGEGEDGEEGEGEDAEDEESAEPAEPFDLARVLGLTRPAEVPDPVVSVPPSRRDQSVPLRPVVVPEDDEESDGIVDPLDGG